MDKPGSMPQITNGRAGLVKAYRLPNNTFAGTEIVADLLVLKKGYRENLSGNLKWVDTAVCIAAKSNKSNCIASIILILSIDFLPEGCRTETGCSVIRSGSREIKRKNFYISLNKCIFYNL